MSNATQLTYKNKEGKIFQSFLEFKLENETIIALFQGSRGFRPKRDFIVKEKEVGKRLRTPTHTHWIVDLLMKSVVNKNLVKEFAKYFYTIYDKESGFSSIRERNLYRIRHAVKAVNEFKKLESAGGYTVEHLAVIIELFIKCEKQSPNAFMFKGLLKMVIDYCDGKIDFYRIVSHSKRV